MAKNKMIRITLILKGANSTPCYMRQEGIHLHYHRQLNYTEFGTIKNQASFNINIK